MSGPRIESVDVARGVAALSVAVYHHGFGQVLAAATGWEYFGLIAWPGSTLAVPLFFVISGFCIHLGGLAQSALPGFASRFYLQRFIRIYPAWFVAVTVSAIVFWQGNRSLPASLVLTHLSLTNGFFDDYRLNSALWSVSVECCLYLIYPLWLLWRRKYGLFSAGLMAAIVSAVCCAVTARFQPMPSGPAMWFFLNVWCGWIAGAVLAELWVSPVKNRLREPRWWWSGAMAAGLHLWLIRQGFYAGPWVYASLPITISLCIWPMAGLLLAGEKLPTLDSRFLYNWIWQPLATVGMFSYSLYLLHIPLQSLRFILLPELSGSRWLKAFVFVAWFGLVLAVSWLCYRWVEVPASRLGRRLLVRFLPINAGARLAARHNNPA